MVPNDVHCVEAAELSALGAVGGGGTSGDATDADCEHGGNHSAIHSEVMAWARAKAKDIRDAGPVEEAGARHAAAADALMAEGQTQFSRCSWAVPTTVFTLL